MLAAHLGEHFLDVDIGLGCGPEMADLETVGPEAVLDEAGLLDRDAVLDRKSVV